MAEPVVEQIAAALFERLQSVTEENDYRQTLEPVRPTSTLRDIQPANLRAVLLQGDPWIDDETDVQGNPYAQAWWQPYIVCIYLRPSDHDQVPIDTRVNRVVSDVTKSITAPADWHTFGGLALQSRIEPPERFDHGDGAHDGVAFVVAVNYRTDENDPDTPR